MKTLANLLGTLVLALTTSLVVAQTIEIVSLNNLGEAGNRASWPTAVSDDGRFVLFVSIATNLIDQDGDGVLEPDVNFNGTDVFVRDRVNGTTELITVNSAGEQANSPSTDYLRASADMSADGRFVAFVSDATNLIDSDGDGQYDDDVNGTRYDVFVHDRLTRVTELVSVNSLGEQANDGSSAFVTISADGRYVLFTSGATNLVDIDGDGIIDADLNGGDSDVFVHDRATGVTEIVDVNSLGEQGNTSAVSGELTPDGRFIAFTSVATNLVDIDGDGVIDVDATPNSLDLYVRDRLTGVTEIASLNSAGEQGGAEIALGKGVDISDDGRFVSFETSWQNMIDIDGDGVIDADLNGFTTDAFVRDRQTRVTEIVDVNPIGEQGNNQSRNPRLSADGRYVAFMSDSINLVDVTGDGSYLDLFGWGGSWIFVRDRLTGVIELVTINGAGQLPTGPSGNAASTLPNISADGRFIVFESFADNLVDLDNDGVFDDDPTPLTPDVYLVDRFPPAIVPDVVGLQQYLASGYIVGAKLTVGTVTQAYDDVVPAGAVISQNPVGGTQVVSGSAVDLVVSLGPVLATVPDVVGLAQFIAEFYISAADLAVGNVTSVYDATAPAGTVISQNPVGGAQVARGSAVDLVVSLGPPQVLVCDVDGNGQIDRYDIIGIMGRRNQPATGPNDPADANGDGFIDANDARQCAVRCTNALCAP